MSALLMMTESRTITPIKVTHELQLQVVYSVEGETILGAPCEGPGDLRMMQVKVPVKVPSVRRPGSLGFT